jgi:hypothetical protein
VTTTTLAGFFGGRLATEGDSCTPGEVAHTADGEMLVCHTEDDAAVLGASAARSTPFTGGPLAVDGQFCARRLRGTLGHSASGEALICAASNDPTTPQWRRASSAEVASGSVTPAVKDATTTRASTDSLPLTGARSMTTALIAVMVLSAGVVLWGRATKKEYDRNWVARHAEPYRPMPPRQAPDDRWHW